MHHLTDIMALKPPFDHGKKYKKYKQIQKDPEIQKRKDPENTRKYPFWDRIYSYRISLQQIFFSNLVTFLPLQ